MPKEACPERSEGNDDCFRGRGYAAIEHAVPMKPTVKKALTVATTHSHPTTTPLLSDEAISREWIYRERGL
jgi:hypothetical protein